jgi:hypothetical protein
LKLKDTLCDRDGEITNESTADCDRIKESQMSKITVRGMLVPLIAMGKLKRE